MDKQRRSSKARQIKRYRWAIACCITVLFSLFSTLPLPTRANPPAATVLQDQLVASNWQMLMQQGSQSYESEDFQGATQFWKEALSSIPSNDRLTRSILLSYLSLAHQQLGEWREAEDSSAEAIELLRSMSQDDLQTPMPNVDQSIYLTALAKALNAQGRLYWSKGEFEPAFSTWEQATDSYKKAGDEIGIIMGLLNQATALQEMGISLQAETRLEKICIDLHPNSPQHLTEEQKALRLPTCTHLLGSNQRIELPSSLESIFRRSLGIAFRRLGKLEDSLKALQPALPEETRLTAAEATIALELGNTERAIANRAIAYDKKESAVQHINNALVFYKRAESTHSSLVTLQAQLNQLSLNLDQVRWDLNVVQSNEPESRTIHPDNLANQCSSMKPNLGGIVRDRASGNLALWQYIQCEIDRVPPTRALIYAQINASESLIRLNQFAGHSENRQQSDWTPILQGLKNTLAQAQRLDDPILEAYVLGQLGAVHELVGQLSDAQILTEHALLKSDEILSVFVQPEQSYAVRGNSAPQSAQKGSIQSLHLPDVRYRLERQLGRILAARGDRNQAIEFYKQAVETLGLVRKDLLTVDSTVQFNFRDDIERVYREFVELLLNPEYNPQPSSNELELAIDNIDELQLAELEDFLGCELLELGQPLRQETQAEAIDNSTAIIYPIILERHVAVILKLPNQPLRYELSKSISSKEVNATLRQLQRNLRTQNNTPESIAGLKEVYQWVIAPIRVHLNDSIKTIVFVLDGQLRNIPMAALYDGESTLPDGSRKHLIHDYAITVTQRSSDLTLFNPEQRPEKLNLFLGGVGIPQSFGQNEVFPAIDFLDEELDRIRNLEKAQPRRLKTSQPLLNAEFIKSNLGRQLSRDRFSAIHIKTHGKFSSDPEETFLVGYGEKITGKELGKLIQSHREVGAKPIELLTLSACETAEGDNRSVLGIAGIAVQAGTRSVVSTLWSVNDKLNTEIMSKFYENLLDPEKTRAEALRQAQLHLFKEHPTPNVWAAYVLVGNWL
jgi:CHAT domain-containing protein